MKCADAGADLVRITVQGGREAEACMHIREKLFKYGYDTPLVADIHFNPKVALRVCDAFEKIRVNGGTLPTESTSSRTSRTRSERNILTMFFFFRY